MDELDRKSGIRITVRLDYVVHSWLYNLVKAGEYGNNPSEVVRRALFDLWELTGRSTLGKESVDKPSDGEDSPKKDEMKKKAKKEVPKPAHDAAPEIGRKVIAGAKRRRGVTVVKTTQPV